MMTYRFTVAAVVLLAAPHLRPAGSNPPVYADLLGPRPGKAAFAVVGDPQGTMFWERFFLLRENNPAERGRVFRELARRRPEFLVIVGDLTSDGASDKHWRHFDDLAQGLRQKGVPVLPVWGNHDYWSNVSAAEREMGARFRPLAGAHWYTRQYGRLALVFLDANVAILSRDEWKSQRQWFEQTLKSFDADSSVDAVLVFEHQPPFTNSTATDDDSDVRGAFVPAFERAHKTVAMISGHTHAYEHFVEKGKHFIVTGGGGGPRVTLRSGKRARHTDLFQGPAPRPFHYLWITPRTGKLNVIVEGLQKGGSTFAPIDRFDLPY